MIIQSLEVLSSVYIFLYITCPAIFPIFFSFNNKIPLIWCCLFIVFVNFSYLCRNFSITSEMSDDYDSDYPGPKLFDSAWSSYYWAFDVYCSILSLKHGNWLLFYDWPNMFVLCLEIMLLELLHMRFLLTTSRHNMLHRYFNSLEIVLQNEKNKKLNLYKNYTLINSNCSN